MDEIITPGIILSVMPIGEYDRRAEILSSDLGRISAFARGARKPGSSLVSVTRAFAFGKFRLYRGKSSYTLLSAEITTWFDRLTEDLDQACYGFYFLEVARYFSRENVESSEMLKLLYFSLRALDLKSVSNRLVRCIYDLKMLDLNGLCPSADRLLSGTGVYSFAKDLSSGCIRAYHYVTEEPVGKLFTFTLSDEVLKEFELVTKQLMRQSTDREFKSELLLGTV